MNYAKIIPYDIANGEGIRTSLFVSGCTNHCPGCFNPEEQDFNYGQPFNGNAFGVVIDNLAKPTTSGFSILGGDPLCQDLTGILWLMILCEYTHSIGKNVWLWTGFVWEDIMGKPTENDKHALFQQQLLRRCDVVVDGPFIEAQADRALLWRGSANQRVIDVKKTLEQGQIILYKE